MPVQTPIVIYIGSEPKTTIARKVLEYSILKNTAYEVEFKPLEGDVSWSKRNSKDLTSQVGTGFSLLRWDVPSRQGYEGFAVYLDADQIVLSDIYDLWTMDGRFPTDKINPCSIWSTYQTGWGSLTKKYFSNKPSPETSVMLIDCAVAKYNQDSVDTIITHLLKQTDRRYYVQMMRAQNHIVSPAKIPTHWNHLNTATKETKLLHYTKEDQQPWYNPKHPFKNIWRDYFIECLQNGILSKKEITDAIAIYKPHTKNTRGTGLHPYWKKFLTYSSPEILSI